MTGKGISKITITIMLIIIATFVLSVAIFTHITLSKRVKYLKEVCTETATGVVYTDAKQGFKLLIYGNIVGAEFILDEKNHYHAGGIDDGKHYRGDSMICHYNPDRPVECYAGIEPSLINKNIYMMIYCSCILIIAGAGIVLIKTVLKSLKSNSGN